MNITVRICLYILVMAGVTYLIRMIPLAFFRKKIKSRFVRSFLYYVPYVTLAVMTFPAILDATGSIWSGLAALLFGIVLAWLGAGLFPISVLCCAVVFVLEFFL